MSTADQRRAKRRLVLPGFPWRGQFATPEEARAYVSQEKLQCLICGKSYNSLGSHINRIHELDETSYKQLFGIPYGVGLVSSPTAELHAVAYVKNISPEERLIHVAKARAELRRRLEGIGCVWRAPVKSVFNKKAQTIKFVNDAPSCIRSCFLCENSVTVKAARVFYKDDMIRCEDCLAPASRRPHKMTLDEREKLRQWAEDNPERATEYLKARSWWSWRRNPFPLLAYAEKWDARLRLKPELVEAAARAELSRRSVSVSESREADVGSFKSGGSTFEVSNLLKGNALEAGFTVKLN